MQAIEGRLQKGAALFHRGSVKPGRLADSQAAEARPAT